MACSGKNWLRSDTPSLGHNLVKMLLDFPIQHAAQTLDQASRLVVRFADADDLIQGRPRGHSEGVLVNDLIAGVELRHDEVDGGAVSQHAMAVSIPVRLCPRKRRQQ